MKKIKKELEIGDHVKEIGSRKRIGEIVSILRDSKKNPSLECIQVHPKELTPLENGTGRLKKFKIKQEKVKFYIPRNKLFEKEKIEVGKYISYKSKTRKRYGRIIGYLNQEEGLYPHSYDEGEYNGKDLLQCVEIDPKPGLHRILDSDNQPNLFVADFKKCKLVKVINTDDKGNETTALRLDIAGVAEW